MGRGREEASYHCYPLLDSRQSCGERGRLDDRKCAPPREERAKDFPNAKSPVKIGRT